MGYTHYWTLENGIEQTDWNYFLVGARHIIDTAQNSGIQIIDGSAGAAIFFNGFGAGSHETFQITSEDVGFNFCKTAQKPYDTVVTACLIHAKKVFGGNIRVSSDGNWSEWQSGVLLYEQIFGIQSGSVLA